MNDRDMKSEIALNIQIMTALLDPGGVAALSRISTATVDKLVCDG